MFLYKQSVESKGIYIEADTLEEAIFEARADFGIQPEARILVEEYHDILKNTIVCTLLLI